MKQVNVGIITADIVSSTEIDFGSKEDAFAQFNEGLELIKKKFEIKYEWYRGDAFQVKTPSTASSLRIALLIKFWIKSFEKENKKTQDVRLSLGIGTIKIDKKELSMSDGEAFRLSGRNLDQLKSSKQLLIIDATDTNSNALKIESVLLNTLINDITSIQAKVLFYKLNGLIEEDIAKLLGLAQSTVNQHSNAGNWNTFSKYVNYFEQMYHNA
ncbi:MAG: hypothetical protein H7239_04165 [Flavobacterium sp.]|nr:hypothetical protein [Flavobacterium sp.]